MIKHGDSTIVPKGDTVINAGDDVILSIPSYRDSGNILLKEYEIGPKHLWKGKTIKELDLPTTLLIIMIKRNGDMVVPNGSTVIKQGDILVVSDQSHIEEKKKMISTAVMSRIRSRIKWRRIKNAMKRGREGERVVNIKWDAEKYTDNFSFVHRHGTDVLKLIERKNGKVLDLGCGNGALTKVLHDKGYDVIGADASDDMLGVARKNNPDLTFVKADATDFVLPEKVDVVFSNAVFTG